LPWHAYNFDRAICFCTSDIPQERELSIALKTHSDIWNEPWRGFARTAGEEATQRNRARLAGVLRSMKVILPYGRIDHTSKVAPYESKGAPATTEDGFE
jgi:hypothetical protein